MKLYNSLSRTVESFEPTDPDHVTMYVCGPTVYDTPHLGNARPAVVFDVLWRVLKTQFDCVEYARNFTDIDDKIMERAKLNSESIKTLTARTITEYHEIMSALNVSQPSKEPCATDFIPSMINQISDLISFGHAYVSGGHVLFELTSWPTHGKLSGHLQENLNHARIAPAEYKHAQGDFVLWKPSFHEQPGWDSPWGFGRPGWHIECSAMISQIFRGQTIDIHGGGADLRFPHHECEISQFEASHDHLPLAKFWLHNAMVLVNGKKMAKSDGNFTTVRQALTTNNGATIRLALLSTHYRSPVDWTDTLLSQAAQSLLGWHKSLDGIVAPAEANGHHRAVIDALNSDLNTSLAISHLHSLSIQLNGPNWLEVAAGFRYAASILGFDLSIGANELYLRGADNLVIDDLIRTRAIARHDRDFLQSDQIRLKLEAMGIKIEDSQTDTKWFRV